MDNQNPTLGDENPLLAWLKAKLMSNQAPIVQNQTAMDQIAALENGPPTISSGTVHNMAQGGPVVPDLMAASGNLNNIQPTNYDFYKDISADNRANLYKQLLAKQNSGGNLAASAAGGLGDAIANSFGGQHTQFQKGITDAAATNTANQIGAIDTQRSQKMQDMSGNQEMMMNDPNSPISQSLRKAANAAGLQVPSMMPANVLIKVIPGFGDLAIKQSTMAIQKGQAEEAMRHNKATEGLTGTSQTEDLKEKEAKRKQDAAEALSRRGPLQRFTDFISPSMETHTMQETLKDQPENGGWKYLGKK